MIFVEMLPGSGELRDVNIKLKGNVNDIHNELKTIVMQMILTYKESAVEAIEDGIQDAMEELNNDNTN